MTQTIAQRLDALTNAQLAALYNSVSERQVTKFSDHSTAVKRTEAALAAKGVGFQVIDGAATTAPQDAPVLADREGDDRAITVLAAENPKQKDSKSHARFALYATAKTVGGYVRAVRELGDTRRKAIRDIQWDAAHEYIRVG